MRHDRLYLDDIIEASDAIAEFLGTSELGTFLDNDLLRSAVLNKLAIIGEAASRLSARLRTRYPQVPWRKIIAFRNLIVHEYFAIDWEIVWLAATGDVPGLRQQAAVILAAEFPEDS
jgi:uncharacterized protein with HEPN domain